MPLVFRHNDERREESRVVHWSVMGASVAALLAVALASGARVASAQSLGEVARREAERRKAVKTPAKVFTNEDLGRSVPPQPVPAVPQGKAEPAKPAPPPPPGEVKDEKYWRGRIQEARSHLSRNQLLLDALQSRVNALSTDFVNRDDPAQRALIAEDRQKALAEMERTRQEIERLRKEITTIEEEARKAGVPPGWLR
jgi:hypothetical protein